MEVRSAKWVTAAVALFVGILAATPVLGQLSPGKLSAAHVELEGSANCLRCHQPGKGVDPQACLSCHEPLRRRIDAGEGLHARPEYERCERCHIEHQGRDFELVWWGEQGKQGFSHGLTGFDLVGAHTEVGCRECHGPQNQVDPAALRAAGTDPAKTFLGLSGGSCLACHEDTHAGTLGTACLGCHVMDGWTPATGFDHDRTAFPLTGAHREVSCTGCHGEGPGTGETLSERFRGRAAARCGECHEDPHAGRLGAGCSSCHRTTGWLGGARSDFDHERTGFSLRGRHRDLACEACHGGGRIARRAGRRGACADCHEDPHGPRHTATVRSCESCHDENGFRPASFGIERHQSSSFPLEGAHLAVPCVACHAPVVGGSLDLSVRSASCDGCHGDPHEGTMSDLADASGCVGCHSVDRWDVVAFDHDRTGFTLVGPHAEAACSACHGDRAPERPVFPVPETACASCHADPHGGQFAQDGATDCARCHGLPSWRISEFDHERRTGYPLEGGHSDLSCVSCHVERRLQDGSTTRLFRGTPRDCAGCHGSDQSPS